MANIMVAPVRPSNFFNTLMNNVDQVEALKQARQQDQFNQLRMQYLPQQEKAKTNLLQQQAQFLPMMQQMRLQQMQAHIPQQSLPLSSLGRLMQDREQAVRQYGHNSLQAKMFDNALQKMSSASNGMQVYGPNGELILSQGGNYFRNPMMGNPRGGAGSTYVNPQTGQAISTNTSPMATSDQTAIAAVQRVIPQIQIMMRTLPQFQSGWKNMLTHLQGISNHWLGANYIAPSERASGLSSLETAPEGLLKAYGLRPSAYALKVMKKTIEPFNGESPSGYQQRILSKLGELREYQDQSSDRLRNGIDLEPTANTTEISNPFLAEIARRKKSGAWK